VALGCVLIYLLTIVGNFIVRSDLMKKKKQYADEVSALKNYFSGIVHLTH
jgi:hypothetical protein